MGDLDCIKKRISNALLALILIGPGLFNPGLLLAQDLGEAAKWPRGTLPLRLPLPDLGFLNHKPAGIHGRVEAVGEDLVFQDGTPARFWGANLQAYALFSTEPAYIKAQAKRIASLGFNLVRIHHHDSAWVNPNIFGRKAPTTTRLHKPSLEKLDLWIDALKAEGVYIWLDLHVGRQVTLEDEIESFTEIAKGKATADIRGFNYISPSLQQRMLDFQDAYLRHVNSFTGLAYSEDPAIIAVLITNENDLTHHYGNTLLHDKGVPFHNAEYMLLAKEFAKEHGLNPGRTWRSWEHGPSKIFLNDLEQRFNERMIAGIRATGFPGLIATTNSWGHMSVAGLPSLTTGSLVDVHNYGAAGEISFDPREKAGLLDWIATAQVAGRPLSISEWNVSPFPGEDRFISPLRMATNAAHQGWDAPIVYGYAQQALNMTLRPSNWDIADDPGMISMMPAAALVYRNGHVRTAEKTYALRLTPERFYGVSVSPSTSRALRTLFEQSKLVVEIPETDALPWLEPATAGKEAIVVSDLDMSYLPNGATEIVADTGEFRRDFKRELFTVDTPRSQIAAGRFASEDVKLSRIQLNIENPLGAIAVQSLDNEPLGSSTRIMISLSARAVPSGKGDVTYRLEPLKGALRISANPDLSLWRPGPRREHLRAAHSVQDGIHVIDLERVGGAHWLVLE